MGRNSTAIKLMKNSLAVQIKKRLDQSRAQNNKAHKVLADHDFFARRIDAIKIDNNRQANDK